MGNMGFKTLQYQLFPKNIIKRVLNDNNSQTYNFLYVLL